MEALDPAKRSSYGDRAMEAAGKIRDAQVAANAVNRLTAGRLGLQPDLKWTASAFDQLAANFWQSGDRTHGRAAIALLKEVSQKGLPPDQGKSALWGVAMLQSRLGDYSGCAATLTSIDEDPRADLCRCMLEGKFPATAKEAREFLAVYRTLPVDDIDPGRSSRERMIRVLVKAGEVAEARKLATGKSPAQSALVGQLAVENHVAEAEKELAAVSDQGWHDESITLIADALLGHGDLNAAVRYLDLASSLNDGTYVIGSRIALACVKAGRFGEAARLGARTDELSQDAIIKELCKAGRVEEALEVVKVGQPRRMHHRYGPDIAAAWCRRGKPDAALAALATPGGFPMQRYNLAAGVANIWSTCADTGIVADWARKLDSPAERCAALAALANANIVKRDPLSRDLAGQAGYPRLVGIW